ncbi:hypothetical protein BJV78DRAFT_1278098 [Lactifluus subvellereus]|nr:hypothetical protein BJV78DRAFT_1278098 [Lactifluus subvellereus]
MRTRNYNQIHLMRELLSIARSTSAAPLGIPTPPLSGFSYLSSLHRGDILELLGPSGSGKSHLLYYLICSCILPLRFGGWNKVSVVFDTDGTFDIHRLQTLLRGRLKHNFPSDEHSTGQIISVALRNVHIFRPNSSSQLAAGLANLSTYHMSNLPTSEIALLAIDSVSAFYWLDRFAMEQHNTAPSATVAAQLPTHTVHPHQTVFTALWTFRRSHCPVVVIVNREIGPTGSGVHPAFQLYKQRLPSFPDRSDGTHLLTHQITLNLAHVVPSHGTNDGQRTSSVVRRVYIHIQIKTGVDHAESLVMQINPERVVITMPDDAHTPESEEK